MKGLRARHRLIVWPASPGNDAIVRDGSREALSSSSPGRPVATRVSACCAPACSTSTPSRSARDDQRREQDTACPGPSAGVGNGGRCRGGRSADAGQATVEGCEQYFNTGIASVSRVEAAHFALVVGRLLPPSRCRRQTDVGQTSNRATRFALTNARGWSEPMAGHDIEPKALLTSKMKPGKVRLDENANSNLVDRVLSRVETAAPGCITSSHTSDSSWNGDRRGVRICKRTSPVYGEPLPPRPGPGDPRRDGDERGRGIGCQAWP